MTQEPTKPARMLMGYRVDSTPIYHPTLIPADAEVCRACDGSGTVIYDDGVDGFQKLSKGRCRECDGDGVICTGDDNGDD